MTLRVWSQNFCMRKANKLLAQIGGLLGVFCSMHGGAVRSFVVQLTSVLVVLHLCMLSTVAILFDASEV